MSDAELRKIFEVQNVCDAFSIYYAMNDILHLDCKKEIHRCGEDIYVRKDQYFTALNFVTEGLLRREPKHQVKWVDYYQKTRLYNNFCYGVLKLKDEYVDSDMLPLITKDFLELWNGNNDLDGKGQISVNPNKNGYIYLEGDITYENENEFWHDLRYLGLKGTFSKRRKYCYDVMKKNISSISPYVDLYYLPTIDGELDEEINLQADLKTNNSIQKVIKKS